MVLGVDTKFVTAKFLNEQARRIAREARETPYLEDEPVRAAVRVLYDGAKAISDARAREMAGNAQPSSALAGPGTKTNVGDPCAKGRAGVKKR